MNQRHAFGALLLLTTQLVAPHALAQVAGGSGSAGGQSSSPPATPAPPSPAQTNGEPSSAATPGGQAGDASQEAQAEVSAPGFDASAGEDVVVVGRNVPNTVRATGQVLSVLSTADIARTGEGDIAGALTRVTGLSVVGNGFVYVRGLGDRYSSALLNGSPLPSPEPLRRSVPLDIFPTTIVGSALIQKTYSVNYPGEFGGGVINLTTKAIPDKNFVTIGGTIGADSVTTSRLGYTYDGSSTDWAGYDSGIRRVPDFIKNAPNGNGIIPAAQVAQLNNAETSLLQRNNHLPGNFSGEYSLGLTKDIGSDRIGLIATASASNTWRARDATQQDTVSENGQLRNDFHTLITDNRAVVNGLLGLGYEFGPNTIRLTNVYIHDTLKQARGSAATVYNNSSGNPIFQQNTNFFERQLFETQGVAELKPTKNLSIDLRGAYANSKRNSPYERQFIYNCNPNLNVVVNPNNQNMATGIQCPGVWQATNAFDRFATIVFSDLNENLYSGQADAVWKVPGGRPFTVSAGYYFSENERRSTRLPFVFQTATGGAPPFPCNLYRPDFLLGPDTVNGCAAAGIVNNNPSYDPGPNEIQLRFDAGQNGSFRYDAKLRVHAGYGQIEAEAVDGLRATIGVRYETAIERVTPVNSPGTRLNNDYFLPASTITWNFAPDMQLRASAAKTIARPQFRELAPQAFRDFESDRLFFGNNRLRDSELWNLEARYEWYYARDQRFSVSGFYKDIDRPIEQVGFFPTPDARLQTGFTYLPSATLYGAEAEVQKYIPLRGLGSADFFATRRAVLIANYTYSHSSINVTGECVPNVLSDTLSLDGCPAGFVSARRQFRDGAPLTGQSDHLVNVQLGIEDTERLSQLTLLFNYASERVTNRGPSNLSGAGFQPDIYERPGIRLDLVARQGFELLGGQVEVKAEARNLTGTRYQERQDFDEGQTVFINRYRLGRIFTLGASMTF